MPVNLEIKAKVQGVAGALRVAADLQARYVGCLLQTDTYFDVPYERLKLRESDGRTSELIEYRRAETTHKRMSQFAVYPCADGRAVKAILKKSFGIRGVVRKRRELFMFGSTRIHIDLVRGLGSFVEFETPVKSSTKRAQKVTEHLIKKFDIRAGDFFKGSYIDLLLKKQRKSRGK